MRKAEEFVSGCQSAMLHCGFKGLLKSTEGEKLNFVEISYLGAFEEI